MVPELRLAVWCTPRTISTALMRSFAQRSDTTCVDEPLYAHYLRVTGLQHPMREAILASQSSAAAEVVAKVLLGPCASPVQFVKHMAHHVVGMDTDFLGRCRSLFLIRDPREMLTSLVDRMDEVGAADAGYARQAELFRLARESGNGPPLVIESRDLLQDPERTLGAVCAELGLSFEEAMLSWPPGRHPCYGVWAPHWYAQVEGSTGFRPYRRKTASFPKELQPVLDQVRPYYEELHASRLRV